MNTLERELIFQLLLGEISENTFLSRFPIDPRSDESYVPRELKRSLDDRDGELVECALLLGFTFGISRDSAGILCLLLEQDWHTSHENIALALQELRDPTTVDCLYRGALDRFAYLDFNDARALAVKCIWALHDIGTPDARDRLLKLAASDDPIVRRNAQERLEAMNIFGG